MQPAPRATLLGAIWHALSAVGLIAIIGVIVAPRHVSARRAGGAGRVDRLPRRAAHVARISE